MSKKIYLASPFFNASELIVYKDVIHRLRTAGYSVYVPQEHIIEDAWSFSNKDWASQVYTEDISAIRDCDVVMILNFGMYSDSGTAWEAGFAYATNKTCIQVLCGANENTTYSLMMINGCHKVITLDNIENWEEISAQTNLSKIIQK